MRAALSAACLLALAPAARAVDGVIEISQARAEAGGVTATDAPGFPVTIGLPGSYRLTSNLDVTRTLPPENTTAIRIESADVTLDLNGFGIFGPATCAGFPNLCTPSGSGDLVRGTKERITVRNGSIRGAGRAGLLLEAAGSIVEGLKVSQSGLHGIWTTGGDGRISGNVAIFNTGFGIIGDGVIQGNVARSNGGGGIAGGLSGQITDNSVDNNQAVGIQNGALVMRNSVQSNTGLGISGTTALGHNVIKDNNGLIGNPPQTSGGIEIAPNVCGNDTICP